MAETRTGHLRAHAGSAHSAHLSADPGWLDVDSLAPRHRHSLRRRRRLVSLGVSPLLIQRPARKILGDGDEDFALVIASLLPRLLPVFLLFTPSPLLEESSPNVLSASPVGVGSAPSLVAVVVVVVTVVMVSLSVMMMAVIEVPWSARRRRLPAPAPRS